MLSRRSLLQKMIGVCAVAGLSFPLFATTGDSAEQRRIFIEYLRSCSKSKYKLGKQETLCLHKTYAMLDKEVLLTNILSGNYIDRTELVAYLEHLYRQDYIAENINVFGNWILSDTEAFTCFLLVSGDMHVT